MPSTTVQVAEQSEPVSEGGENGTMHAIADRPILLEEVTDHTESPTLAVLARNGLARLRFAEEMWMQGQRSEADGVTHLKLVGGEGLVVGHIAGNVESCAARFLVCCFCHWTKWTKSFARSFCACNTNTLGALYFSRKDDGC